MSYSRPEYFWYGNNCDSEIWLASLKFLGLECPVVKRGFILVNEKLNEACRRFVNYMLDEFECVKIISLLNIMVQAWLITESINCRIIKNLFGNSYLVLKTEQLDSFLLYLTTNLFNSKVENYYQCVLSFKYKKVSKLNSRKRNCCFFRAKAVCKFNSCFEFCFTTRENPTNVIVDGIVVNCAVTGTLSPEHNNTCPL